MADAVTKIADLYDPLVFAQRTQLAQTRSNGLIQAGVAVEDPILRNQFGPGGTTAEINHLNALTIEEPNYSTDDNTSNVEVDKITSGTQKVRRADRNKHYSAMSLARMVGLGDPVEGVTNQIGSYWASDNNKRLFNSLIGIKADNSANDSGDMIKTNAKIDHADAVADAERVSSTVVAQAKNTLGDMQGMITAIAVHSTVFTRMRILEAVKDFHNSETGDLEFSTFDGLRVIIDDDLVTAGTNRSIYTCILFGLGAVGYAELDVESPFALYRKEESGDGGGEQRLASRVSNVMHPYGFSYVGTPANGRTATYAELATATHWDRIAPRKNAALAFLEVND
ncbi:MAG: hypothetical protein ACPHJZ_02965 [Limisphaerales bacterium]